MIAKTVFSLNHLYLYCGPDILQIGIRSIHVKMPFSPHLNIYFEGGASYIKP